MAEPGQCPQCGERNAPGQQFCGACGSRLARRCPSCGSASPGDFRFCGQCGTPLDEAAADGGAQAPREERRWATVVFADLSGFTRLSEQSDPEDIRSLVDRCVARMAGIVSEHGGWFDRVLGDGVLAVFGAEIAHGDDAERAVRTALALRRCSIEHSEDFAGLPLSIGVNTGEVMFAAVGPAHRRDHTVMGDAVNTAARLQAAAAPGTILVGEETWRATRSSVGYDAVPPVHAKGKQEPVAAWMAVDAVELESGRPVSDVPFIGRQAEVALLSSTWDRVVADRRPHLVTVIGPAGIGKTRLAGELASAVERSGGRVARGRSLPYGESTGYGAFTQVTKRVAGIADTGDASAASEALQRFVRARIPSDDAAEVAANLATLIGLPGGSDADKQSLFFSARRFVEALARETPTLLLFEDIHWGDPTLLELIESLASRCRDAPVLILTLARPELFDVAVRWGGGVPTYAAITLDPLTEEEAQRLAARHLGIAEESPVVSRLAAVGEGNPLFIEELSTSIVEHATAADGELPTNVRAIIAARIDALPPGERAVLLDASVVGKVFWKGALDTAGQDALVALDALERRDLIREEPVSRIPGDREFTFRHMLIREVAYSTLPRATRRERHAGIARFIETTAADRTVESASILAHHWREAGDAERAVDYLVTAAEGAGRAWAAEEATQLYSEALELLAPDDVDRRRAFRLARGLLLIESAFYAEGVPDIDAVLSELRGRDRAEALLARGNAAVWLMDGHHARRCGEEALALANDTDEALVGPALSLIANAGSIDGRLEAAMELQRRSLEQWMPGTRPRLLGLHLAMMSLTSYWAGDYEHSIEHARRSYELAIEHQSVTALLQGGSHLGLALTGAGRHEEALQVFEKVVAQGEELEARPRLTSRTLNMMATTLREIGADGEARLRNEQGMEYATQADFAAARCQGGIDLVFADLADGEVGRARGASEDLRQRIDALDGWHQWLGLIRLAHADAELALAAGDASMAAGWATECVRQAAAVGRRKYEALARATLASALVELGRHDEAIGELGRAALLSTELGHPATTWRVGDARVAVLRASGRDVEAEAAVAGLSESVEAFAAGLSDLRREQFLESRLVASVLGGHRD